MIFSCTAKASRLSFFVDGDPDSGKENLAFLVDTEWGIVNADLETGSSIYDLQGWVTLHCKVSPDAGNKQEPAGHIVHVEANDDHNETYFVDVNLGKDLFDRVANLHAFGHMPTFSISLGQLTRLNDDGTHHQVIEGDVGWRWLNRQHRQLAIEYIDISFRQGRETDE